MDPFIGQIMMFGGNFAPRGWAFCNGQLLSIAQNTALFSILGTIYGGDGRTTFGLPELRGRVAVHSGNSTGPGLTNRRIGERGGSQTNTLNVTQLPAHNHNVQLAAEGNIATEANPTNNMLAVPIGGEKIYAPDDTAAEVVMNSKSIRQSNVGNNQPVNNMQPYTAVNYIIALIGTFPSRN
jgi:microcystin-dependent protein